MEYLGHFSTFIQLMAGVNFAFIIVDFVKRSLNVLFDSKSLLNDRYQERNTEIVADLESVKSMSPLNTQEGLSNEPTITALKKDYELFSKQWNTECQRLRWEIKGIKKTQGFRVFFLYASIYSVLSLIFIGISQNLPYSWNYTFFACAFNMFSYILCAWYIYQILTHKGKRMTKAGMDCVLLILICLILSALITGLNAVCISHGCYLEMPNWVLCILTIGCIVIPIVPIIFATLFIAISDYCYKKKVNALYEGHTGALHELHTRKLDLDKIYKQFTKPNYNSI